MRKIIAIEGIDGSGKTSLGERLEDLFPTYKVGYIKIPRYTYQKLSSLIGRGFYKIMTKMEEGNNKTLVSFFLKLMVSFYNLARMEENSSSILLVERHPLIDSYAYSSIYSPNFHRVICCFLERIMRIKKPDVIIFLYCDPYIALKRIINRIKVGNSMKSIPHLHERLKSLDLLQKKLWEKIRCLSENGAEIILVDTSNRSKEEVFNCVKDELNKLFNL